MSRLNDWKGSKFWPYCCSLDGRGEQVDWETRCAAEETVKHAHILCLQTAIHASLFVLVALKSSTSKLCPDCETEDSANHSASDSMGGCRIGQVWQKVQMQAQSCERIFG
jgi:hypothetical protein